MTLPQHKAQAANAGSHRGQCGLLHAVQLQDPLGLLVGRCRGEGAFNPLNTLGPRL